MAERMPIRRLFWKVLETAPAKVGPPEQPRSPASASRANMAVPPPLMEAAALLKVPGQRMPTEKPQTAQPTSPATGLGIREMQR